MAELWLESRRLSGMLALAACVLLGCGSSGTSHHLPADGGSSGAGGTAAGGMAGAHGGSAGATIDASAGGAGAQGGTDGGTDAGVDASDSGEPDAGVCTPNPCSLPHKATCTDDAGQPKCSCDAGYHDDGSGGCTDDPCVPSPCTGNDRVCVALTGQAVCNCAPGLHDEQGNCVPDATCQANSCNGHGSCADTGGIVSCSCDAGWAGAHCEDCDLLGGYHADGAGGCTRDPCSPNPCVELNKGVCDGTSGSAVCGCDPGTHDEAGACVVNQTCMSSSCSGHGACNDATGIVVCTCDAGYAAPTCGTCAAGFHDDGAGACTDDPCTPNPCTELLKTVCVASGADTSCQCDADAHADGQGGCTTDPCTPNPCAAQNQACRATSGTAECYTPDCDDKDPCTDDTRVSGICRHATRADGSACVTTACLVGQTCQSGACVGGDPANCDDANPCTDDTCDDVSGCVNAVNVALIPDDAIACSVDSCDASGVAHHTPSDAACDDGKYCTGVEKCQPGSGADARGCVVTSVPVAPASTDACVTYGACQESTPHFPKVTLPTGTACDDHIACTTSDACKSDGSCVGTEISGCLDASCSTTGAVGAIDVPVATISAVNVTLNNAALPSAASPDSSAATFFLRAHDTGALHDVRVVYYTTGGGPWPAGAAHTTSILPGVYDVVYRRDYTPSSNTVSENPAGDLLPQGYRVLQNDLMVSSGANTLSFDVPVATLSAVNVTLNGAALPSAASPDSSAATFFLRSHDTGALHDVRVVYYTTGGGPWPANAAHSYSLIPGTYDVVYARDYSATTNTVSQNPTGDLLPNGYRVLSRDLSIAAGSNTVNIDVPVATLSAVNVTLNGAALPSTTSPDSSAASFYLRATDTGALHDVRDVYYTTGGGPWPAGATHAASILPGTYDVLYGRDYSQTTNVVSQNPTGDVLPNGYRVLQTGVTLGQGSNSLDIDVPVATLSAVNVTLDGAALPSASSPDSSAAIFYLRAKDTGALHDVREVYYTTGGGPWPAGATHAASLLPGTYDVVYSRDYSSTTNIVSQNPTGDLLPNGYRVLATDVTLAKGANTLNVDVPVAKLGSVTILLDSGALPSGPGSDSSSAIFYLRAHDTGALHEIRYVYYTTGGGPWPAGGTHAASILPGTYDLVFSRDYSQDTNVVSENPSYDLLPNGYRVLAEDIVLTRGNNDLVFDLHHVDLSAAVTLAGQPLPSGPSPDSSAAIFYLRARDTHALHDLRNVYYTSGGGPWPSGAPHAKSIPPGVYDLFYSRDYAADTNSVSENPTGDLLPNGYRILGRCLLVE